MADWAYNPLHGWTPGPFDALNCEYPFFQPPDASFYDYQFQDPMAPNVNGFFPAPPGLQWVDLAGGGLAPIISGGGSSGCSGGGGCSGGSCGGGGMMLGNPYMMSGGIPSSFYPGQMQYLGGDPADASKDAPGINLYNSTGGIGLEPGYNYIFPDSHIFVHVLKSSIPPWQLEGTEEIEYQAHKVPSCVSVGTMMKGFGCDNEDKKKNVLYEVVQAGNGKWYRGISVNGGEGKKTDKAVGEMGWSTDGDVTWLYFTKD